MPHLSAVCMTYAEHFRLSMSLAWLFLKASACALVHAWLPDVLASASTDYVRLADARIRASGCKR